MTDDQTRAVAQPVDEPIHSHPEGVAAPQDNPESNLTNADRQWVADNNKLATEPPRSFADEMKAWLREHEAEARAMLGVQTEPTVQTTVTTPPNQAGDYSSGDDVDTSKPHYRHVLADGTDVLMGPDCAVPTHHGDDAVPVVASYLVPARSTN